MWANHWLIDQLMDLPGLERKRETHRNKHSLVTVSVSLVIWAEIWMRPLLSVWSVPHRLGTLATHLLWMFIIQSGAQNHKDILC